MNGNKPTVEIKPTRFGWRIILNASLVLTVMASGNILLTAPAQAERLSPQERRLCRDQALAEGVDRYEQKRIFRECRRALLRGESRVETHAPPPDDEEDMTLGEPMATPSVPEGSPPVGQPVPRPQPRPAPLLTPPPALPVAAPEPAFADDDPGPPDADDDPGPPDVDDDPGPPDAVILTDSAQATCPFSDEEVFARYHKLGENYRNIDKTIITSNANFKESKNEVLQAEGCSPNLIEKNQREIDLLTSLPVQGWMEESIRLNNCAGLMTKKIDNEMQAETRPIVLDRLMKNADRSRHLGSDLTDISRGLAYLDNKAARLMEGYQSNLDACAK